MAYGGRERGTNCCASTFPESTADPTGSHLRRARANTVLPGSKGQCYMAAAVTTESLRRKTEQGLLSSSVEVGKPGQMAGRVAGILKVAHARKNGAHLHIMASLQPHGPLGISVFWL